MQKRKSFSQRLGGILRGLLLWPLVGILSVLGIRFALVSNPGRIGHMAAELDYFLKERALGLIPPVRPILVLDRERAGNLALLDLFKDYLPVVDKRWQRHLLSELLKFDAVCLRLGRPIVGLSESTVYPRLLELWGDRPPIFVLPDEIERRGRARLAELGVPEGAWFVSAHAREAGYSPRDEHFHGHRNADILTYGQAFEAITEAGGWVVRVGDPTMRPLPPMANVVDYATSPLKADWMDLWLCANNRFFLGTSSGLCMVATMFSKPCALVNMIPLGASLGMAPTDLSIPKRIVRDGTEIPFRQVFDEHLSRQRFTEAFDSFGVEIRDNTPEEVRRLTQEMLDRLDGRFEITEDDENLQLRFRALMSPYDYCFGATSRIGRDWLRENRHLL